MNKLYEVQINRNITAKEVKLEVAYYVAASIKAVIAKLKPEFYDNNVEVVAIKAMVPIVDILK